MKHIRVGHYLAAHDFTSPQVYGGIETHTAQLARACANQGCISIGLLPDAPNHNRLAESFTSLGLPCERIRPITSMNLQQLLTEFRQTQTRLHGLHLDVLHLQRALPRFGKWAIMAARAAGIPVVVTTDHDLQEHVSRSTRFANNVIDRLTDRIFTVSDYSRQQQITHVGRSPAQVRRVYNGIDTSVLIPGTSAEIAAARAAFALPADAFVLGTVARLVSSKRVTDLLQAAAALAPNYPNLIILISGEGPLRGELEAEATALGIAHQTKFLGFHPDLLAVLRALDLFVLPSSWEAFGLVATEAMACAKPAIVTSAGGLPEVVTDGKTGFVVPVGNVPALANAINTCLVDPALRQQMGIAARCRVERLFSRQSLGVAMTDNYRELLMSKRRV